MTTVDYYHRHATLHRAVSKPRPERQLYLNWILIIAIAFNAAIWAGVLMALV